MMRDCLKHGPTFRSSMTCPECLREIQASGKTFADISVKKPDSGVIEPMVYPSYLPKPGDELILTQPIWTLAKHTYKHGDKFFLVEPTGVSPHGYQSGLCNWIVRCKYTESVWSSIWHMIDTRVLVPESVFMSEDFKRSHVGTHFIGERDAGNTTSDRGTASKAD